MKLLLDECLPQRLRTAMPGHDVYTVAYMGWSGVSNGQLLALAIAEGFDAFITSDRGVAHQQNVNALAISIVILEAPSNDLSDLLPLVPNLLTGLASLTRRGITHIRA